VLEDAVSHVNGTVLEGVTDDELVRALPHAEYGGVCSAVSSD
jgi:hypothetical protein